MRSRLLVVSKSSLVVALLAAAWVLPLAAAFASKPRIRLERVDARACREAKTVRAYVSELELEGELRRRTPSEYRLLADEREVARRPDKAVSFADTEEPLAVAVVIENGPAYANDLQTIKTATTHFIEGLPRRSELTLIAYAAQPQLLLRRGNILRALRALDRLASDPSAVDMALMGALQVGMRALSRGTESARRLLVVLSDGIDRQPDWSAFRAMGQRAARLGIAVFPIAYSSIDERGPLLNLGELAKRSGGSLRWARTRDELQPALEQLSREISEQLVLSFRWPACQLEAKVRVGGGGLRSNAVTVFASATVGEKNWESGGRSWRWIAIGAVLVLLGALMLLVTRWVLRGLRP